MCHRALANWSGAYGGYPSVLTDIVTCRDKVQNFISFLLGHQDSYVSKGVKDLLVANLFRFYENFVSLVKSEPRAKFTNPRNHVFVNKVLTAAKNAGTY